MGTVIIFDATYRQKNIIMDRLTELTKTIPSQICLVMTPKKKSIALKCENDAVEGIKSILDEMGIQARLWTES